MANVGFQRYFTVDPGDDVLLAIEGVNIIDQTPPAPLKAAGTGVVCLVAEYEDGPFNLPTEVVSGQDFQSNFGQFGYVYNGVPAQNPCARTRFADATLTPEYWNGNGAVAVSGKNFFRLIVVRVNTSVGTVNFTRCASLTGVGMFTYALQSGQHLDTNEGSGTTVSTFTGVVASVLSVSATYALTAGETVTLAYDGLPPFVVTFLAGDTTQGNVIARINQYAGFAFAAVSGGQYTLKGRIAGLNGSVDVIAASSGGVLTALGLTVALTPGTGNVGDISHVKFSELQTIVQAADVDVKVEMTPSGQPRIYNFFTPGTGTLLLETTSTATAFGFPFGVTASAASGNAGTIPAGTVLTDGTQQYVTMQTTNVTAVTQANVTPSGPGPYTIPVRFARDDDTGTASSGGTINALVQPLQLDSYVVINPSATTNALTEPQIDNAYLTAFNTTLNINSIARLTNIMLTARQSDTVRQGLRQNVIAATAAGLVGRTGCVRPPLGIAPSVAESLIAEPGVGATASDRVDYVYPGASTRIAAMAQVGLAGGAGFTANGIIDVGSDIWLGAFMSILAPEENPGQDPTQVAPWMENALGLESSAFAQNLVLQDYENFKSVGICGARYDMDNGILFFQSGITSSTTPGLTNINRRRMADYLQDSLASAAQPYVKQLSKSARRQALLNTFISFAESLLGRTNQNQQRIAGYTINDSPTTPSELAQGLYRILTNFRTLSSLDSITLMSTVGESVQVDVLAPGETQ